MAEVDGHLSTAILRCCELGDSSPGSLVNQCQGNQKKVVAKTKPFLVRTGTWSVCYCDYDVISLHSRTGRSTKLIEAFDKTLYNPES